MKLRNGILIVISFVSTFQSIAARDVYFGEDVSPYDPVPTGPNTVPLPAYTNSHRVASQFLQRLPGVLTESFEGLETGSSPTLLQFGTNMATLVGPQFVRTMVDPATAAGGGFAVTGTNYISLPNTGHTTNMTVTFSTPQGAFGFYGMDVEFNQFSVKLYHASGGTSTIPVPVTVPQGSGGVFYFGVLDKENPFSKVEFQSIGTDGEGFFFDDLTIAVPEIITPPRLDIRVTQIELCWDTVTSTSYQLQYMSSIDTNVWLPFGTVVSGDGSRFCTNDAVIVGQPQKFYRLSITNSP